MKHTRFIPAVFIALVILLLTVTQCRADTCWDKAGEGDNGLWVIAKLVVSPFVCIPADIINSDFSNSGTDNRRIYNIDTEQGTTTYIVTPRTSGVDVLVIK